MQPQRRVFLQSAVGSATGAAWLGWGQAAMANESSEMTFRDHLLSCLGGQWPEPCSLAERVDRTEQQAGYRLETVSYDVEPGERVSTFLLIPDGVTAASPAPAICLWHEHAGRWSVGKAEPAGLAGDPMHFTGVALAKLGYVVICPDALCFGERQDPEKKLDGPSFERFEFLRYVVAGKCLAWKHILDMRRAVDYLITRPEVTSDRIGCYGHSMGSTHTWLVGPWEPRIRCLVGNCCLPTYEGIHRTKILHCFPNFIPGLFEYGDTPEIASLIAPRPLHFNLGEMDEGSPIEEAREGIQRIAAAYAAMNASQNFTSYIQPATGHVLSPEMWTLTREFFQKHLQRGSDIG